MIKDDFEPFEVDKLIKAMELFVRLDGKRDGDAKHILELLKQIRENKEVLTVVDRSLRHAA